MVKTKKVNIYPSRPIVGVNPPIRSAVKGVTKSISEIRTCIIERATVEEIIDGKTIRLDFTNYDKDNSVVEEKPVVEAVVAEVPVQEETTTEESLDEVSVMDTTTNISEYTEEEQAVYDKAYAEAIGDKDLSSMTRKERRRAERSAKDLAAQAVAKYRVASASVEKESDKHPDENLLNEEPTVETVDLEEVVGATDTATVEQ